MKDKFRYKVIYSTPITDRAVQIVKAETADQAVDVVKAFEIPTEILSVKVESIAMAGKWFPVSWAKAEVAK